jgi:hypothetical protein
MFLDEEMTDDVAAMPATSDDTNTDDAAETSHEEMPADHTEETSHEEAPAAEGDAM